MQTQRRRSADTSADTALTSPDTGRLTSPIPVPGQCDRFTSARPRQRTASPSAPASPRARLRQRSAAPAPPLQGLHRKDPPPRPTARAQAPSARRTRCSSLRRQTAPASRPPTGSEMSSCARCASRWRGPAPPSATFPRPFLGPSPQAHELLRGRGAYKLLTEGNCPLLGEGGSLRWMLVLMANPLLLEPQHHKPAREIGPRSARDRPERPPPDQSLPWRCSARVQWGPVVVTIGSTSAPLLDSGTVGVG